MALIQRTCIRAISGFLSSHALALVDGPPRSGLSTLARQLAAASPAGAVLADARLRVGRAILEAPDAQSAARPVILDNASADDARRLELWSRAASASRRPRFVLVGGPFPRASLDAPVTELGPFTVFETGRASIRRLWLRGGYPEAFGAASDEAAAAWLEGYAADLAYGRLSDRGLPREPERIGGLLRLVAQSNGRAFNETAAARALGASRPTVCRYVDALESAGLLFSVPAVPPELAPGVSRPARSAALYFRDSGLCNALLGLGSQLELAANTGAANASWRGFVVAQARAALPPGVRLYQYASADGAALELVVERGGAPVVAAAASRHRPSSVRRQAAFAARALSKAGGAGLYVVCPDGEDRRLPGGFVATSLGSFLDRIAAL